MILYFFSQGDYIFLTKMKLKLRTLTIIIIKKNCYGYVIIINISLLVIIKKKNFGSVSISILFQVILIRQEEKFVLWSRKTFLIKNKNGEGNLNTSRKSLACCNLLVTDKLYQVHLLDEGIDLTTLVVIFFDRISINCLSVVMVIFFGACIECVRLLVQALVKLHQRLSNWYLLLLCLSHSIKE